MDKIKQWVALTLVGALAVLAVGWLLVVSPTRAKAAELRGQADAQQSTNRQLETQLAVLKAQAKDLPKEQAKLAAVATKIPDNAGQPALLRALAAAADAAGVEFVSVAPGALAPFAPATATDAAAADPTATDATAGTAAAAGSAGTLLGMSLTIKIAGGYYETEEFVALLEELPRALRISGLTITPGANPVAAAGAAGAGTEDGRSLVTDITGTVFVASGATSTGTTSTGTTPAGADAAPLAPAAAPTGTVAN